MPIVIMYGNVMYVMYMYRSRTLDIVLQALGMFPMPFNQLIRTSLIIETNEQEVHVCIQCTHLCIVHVH